jgi:hypothetical protein
MATTVQVTKVKAADPGLGFTLQISNNGTAINDTLKVVITISDRYSSSLVVNNPVTDQCVIFIVPFGSSSYDPGTVIRFRIDVYVPNSASAPIQTLTGVVMSDADEFTYASAMPFSVTDSTPLGVGGMMNSLDANYFGIMQRDGNFCVYQQSAVNSNSLPNTDSTYSDKGLFNCSLQVRGGRIFVHDNASNTDISASPASQPVTNGSMVINSSGMICLQAPGGQPVQVQVRPGNLP